MGAIKTGLVVILIVLAVIFGIRILSPEDTWICKNGSWQTHGHPQSPSPTTPCKPL